MTELKTLKDLRALARELGFNGFRHISQMDFMKRLLEMADKIEEDLKW